ncbi:MAG: hypothetical protein A2Z49_04870 [Chloroflexi bacterium RBG_19FT_COMBO_56_12]|nr:MAG: hypothetical protein A2Z49_04870 [Chloroflexi bacterium RBG_19FT_COMBO_56_12]
MNIIGSIIAGLLGTLAMTLLMIMAPRMGMPKMDIIGMLGTMFTASEGAARVLGTPAHFMMGVIFAIIYSLLWSLGIGSPTWLWGLIFGAVHGVVVMVMMPVVTKMLPRPPQIESGPLMVVGLLMGHLAFGLVVALTYAAFV